MSLRGPQISTRVTRTTRTSPEIPRGVSEATTRTLSTQASDLRVRDIGEGMEVPRQVTRYQFEGEKRSTLVVPEVLTNTRAPLKSTMNSAPIRTRQTGESLSVRPVFRPIHALECGPRTAGRVVPLEETDAGAEGPFAGRRRSDDDCATCHRDVFQEAIHFVLLLIFRNGPEVVHRDG